MKPNVTVIPQIRTYTRYRMGSVVMFNCAESPISTQRRFRISELTSNVPYAVRSTLRNDSKGLAKFQLLVKLQLYIIDAPLYCEEKNGRQVQDQA